MISLREYSKVIDPENIPSVADNELLELLRETAEGYGLEGAHFHFSADFASVPASADLVFYASLDRPPEKKGRRFVSIVDFYNIDYRLS